MRTTLKWVRRLLLLLLILCVVLTAGGYTYLRASLPQVDGVIATSGRDGPIEIIRDVDAVPHIYAQSRRDALFGLGYVHAQDRLWQIEFQRRIGQGRLSEILGSTTLPIDRFLRTLGSYRAARSAWESSSTATKELIGSYAAGINAFIDSHQGSALPPEFTMLGLSPEPWTGPDVIVWQKMMAWDLGGNYEAELLHNDLRAAVGTERFKELFPKGPTPGPTIVSEQATSYAALARINQQIWRLLGESGFNRSSLGSNSWAVDGEKSTTGKPILANDPHLGAHLPSTWYIAHLSAGDFDVIGATLPGLPAVISGRNRSIAWGVTNMQADVQDLFQERLDAAGQQAEFRGQMEPMQVLTETIKVKGEPDIAWRVRITRHGPLISDAVNVDAPKPLSPVALRWSALEPGDTTIEAFMNINSAANWEQFRHALRGYLAPAQNFVYADVDGNIGYQAPGRIPIRARMGGQLPAEGWSGADEWIDWIPFEVLPHGFNPPEHFIATANNQPAPDSYPYYLGAQWSRPHRAERIIALLRERSRLSPDDFATIQRDTRTLFAKELVSEMTRLAQPQAEQERRAVELLQQWDGDAARDSVAATIFAAWYMRLTPAILGDELGTELAERYDNGTFLLGTLKSSTSQWCDSVTTAERESCATIASTTLRAALDDLTTRLGPDMTGWQWEQLHIALFNHQPLGEVPVLGSLFNRSVSSAGHDDSINVGSVSRSPAFSQSEVASYRQILDLSTPDGGRFIHAGGQSGHILSPHYDDYLADWQAVRYRPLRFDRATVVGSQAAALRLAPQADYPPVSGSFGRSP